MSWRGTSVGAAEGWEANFCSNVRISVIGRIASSDPKLNPLQIGVFDGYWKQDDATNKKVLRDVFVKGDAWFATGDLLRIDREGYVCGFWKGKSGEM